MQRGGVIHSGIRRRCEGCKNFGCFQKCVLPGIPVPVPVGCLELMQSFLLVGGGGGAAAASTASHPACGGEEEDSRSR